MTTVAEIFCGPPNISFAYPNRSLLCQGSGWDSFLKYKSDASLFQSRWWIVAILLSTAIDWAKGEDVTQFCLRIWQIWLSAWGGFYFWIQSSSLLKRRLFNFFFFSPSFFLKLKSKVMDVILWSWGNNFRIKGTVLRLVERIGSLCHSYWTAYPVSGIISLSLAFCYKGKRNNPTCLTYASVLGSVTCCWKHS